jgi:flavin reductase (DIM6/NTAB) family NADH-FMN oxidoreductase RutF
MTIEKDFFRQVMGHFATGVTVVTTNSKDVMAGLTVNAFCSVSLNPPLVLVCVDLQSSALVLIRESGTFAVNMLTEQQEELSRCFAIKSALNTSVTHLITRLRLALLYWPMCWPLLIHV